MALPKLERPDIPTILLINIPIDIIVGLFFVYLYCDSEKDGCKMPLLVIAHIAASSPILARLFTTHT